MRMRNVRSSAIRDILALTANQDVVSFAGGMPAPELFDGSALRACFDHVLGHHAGESLQYSTTEGDPRLRARIAARATGRGLPTHADDLLITSGSQQGLTLLATVLLEPGETILVERPTYLAALQAFNLAGARIVSVPCDEHGLDPAALPDLIRRERPKLLYTIPTFQNPSGRTLSLHRRRAIAEIAARHGTWIIEDDPYSELRYRGEPVAPIAVQPGAEDRTISLSSLSKIMAPGLRLGAVRAPGPLLRQLCIAKQTSDLHTSTIDQAAAAEYLVTADLDAHLGRVRRVYAERRDTLLDTLPGALPPGATWSDPDGGMFVWVRLPGDVDTTAALPGAIERLVAYAPGAPFFADRPDRATFRLSFVTNPPEAIIDGVTRLGKALIS
ncbi:MAG: PLP-dependent aminotransferase family protein [Dactylosporangium sp.]|nr:PLP-dependent aminotransferase family protein [Dactylosporangium sp.]